MKKISVLLLVSMIMFSFQTTALAGRECKNLEKAVVKAVKKVEVKAGCAAIGLAFETACSAATAVEGVPECTIGSAILGANCKVFGKKYVQNEAKDIARDICDYIYPDTDPYIMLENHLKSHKVDFRAVISHAGDDVHMRGNNWLEAEGIGILASHKLTGENFDGTVKARVKISCDESLLPLHPDKYAESCKDKHLTIHHVKPNKHRVYVYYKDGKYHIHKKKLKKSFKPFIPIENHLKKHKIDFRVVIAHSPDVHLPGDDWLKPDKKATLYSYKLYKDSYTVKARIKKKGMKSDIHETIHHVKPGLHKVYVYYKDGHYHIDKKKITKKFYSNRMIPVENHLKTHDVDFRVVIDHGPDVHFAGNNWLKHGGKSVLVSHKLYRDNYKIKARVKRDGAKIDKHLTVESVKPGQHKVYVYHKDGEYHIGKDSIK